MSKIHKDLTIDEILSLFPQKAQKLTQLLTEAGLHCVGCHAATWETLEGGDAWTWLWGKGAIFPH